jgi:hypothetical protein
MAAEAFEMAAELIFAVGEGAAGSKSKGGCFITIVLLLLLVGGVYWYCESENKQNQLEYVVKGVVKDKLSNNTIVIESNGIKNPYTLSKELYDNKFVGDSIRILK